MNQSREVPATDQHVVLMEGLARVVHDFQKMHPTMDIVEIISVLGTMAGAFISNAPDEQERDRARQSVINSMDCAITDWALARARAGAGSA